MGSFRWLEGFSRAVRDGSVPPGASHQSTNPPTLTSAAHMRRPGPDSTASRPEDDHFHRLRFARQIVDLIKRVPLDQQLTVGIYGRWGTGKTTVLEMIEDIASGQGMLRFWLNPWGLLDRDDLWATFLLEVISTLRSAGVAMSDLEGLEARALRFKWMPLVDDISKAAKPVEAAMAGLRRQFRGFFGVGVEDLRMVSSQLVASGRRLLILVDDLDRASGPVVMDVLYGVRELLDLPGFTFVLAFDPDQVAAPGRSQNPDRSVTQQFLEKVIHIPRWLPEPTDSELLALFESDVRRYCLPITLEDLKRVLDLLPRNPRQARIFIRQFWSLSDELGRYGGDEIDAAALLLITLVKASWPDLASKIFDSPETVSKSIIRRTVFLSQEKEAPRLEKEKQAFLEMCTNTLGLSAEDADRAAKITGALTERSLFMTAERIVGHAHLIDRPPNVTLKKAEEALGRFARDLSADTLRKWIADHAAKRDLGPESVIAGLFNSWTTNLGSTLHEAADTTVKVLSEDRLLRARTLRAGLGVLGLDLGGFSQTGVLGLAEFKRCLGLLSTWIQFQETPGYRELLEDLISFLLAVAEGGNYRALEWLPGVHLSSLEAVASLAPEILKDSMDRIQAAIRRRLPSELLALFSMPTGLRSLRGEERLFAFTELSSAESELWKGEFRSKFLELCRQPSTDVSMNLMAVLENLSNIRFAESQAVALAGDKELILAIWEGATTFEVTQRARSSVVAIRKRIEKLGGFPLPSKSWLEVEPASNREAEDTRPQVE
jgi:hypothetical protein